MLPVLLILFIIVPIVELAVIIQVGQSIGVLPTVAILIVDSVLGAMLMRSQGRAAWRRFNTTLAAGRPPAREVLDGALVIFGGALLLTPGFVTDIFGMLFLIPPTRAVVRRIVSRRLLPRMVVSSAARFTRTPPGGPRGGSYDVEGTATEVPNDPPRLP